MIGAPERRLDVTELFSAYLDWEVDPEHLYWLRARRGDEWIRMRFNIRFPDVPAYSLLIGPGEYYHFDDLPTGWKRLGPLTWPADAEKLEQYDDED